MNEYATEVAIEELRDALRKTQKQLAKAKQRTDELVAVTHAAAREAMLAAGGVKLPPKRAVSRSKRSKEVALWHLTDWQGSKVTPSYNSQVM